MDIQPNEVKEIKDIGDLHGDKVKMVVTIGGLYMAVGKKSRSKKTMEPLAAGSHPGLVMHQIEKQYSSDFRPHLMKSEIEEQDKVVEISKQTDKGIQVFRITKSNKVDILVTKFLNTVAKCEGEIIGNDLVLNKTSFVGNSNKEELAKEITKGILTTIEDLKLSEIKKK